MPLRITILANKSNPYGIAKDVEGLTRVFSKYTVQVCDPLEPPVYSDVTFHLEVPVYCWMPWSAKNIFVVNPEWYVKAWDSYIPKFDHVIIKDLTAASVLPECKTTHVAWAHHLSGNYPNPTLDEFVWVLGASVNKRAYVETLLSVWKPSYPGLTITTTTSLDVTLPENVNVVVREFNNPEERREFFGKFKGQVCCSRAEGFGYTAAEAELFGAFTILNSLPPYVESYKNDYRVAFLPSKFDGLYDIGATKGALEEALDVAMDSFSTYTLKDAVSRRSKQPYRWANFTQSLQELIVETKRPEGLQALPPILLPADCPPISIVTLMYNRRKFFDLALHSVMVSDYPKHKIEWIIVDDSDDPAEMATDRINEVLQHSEPLKMVYVPLVKKVPVSEKRNIGIRRATSDIILLMDDDDHYPETSFRRRVAWLLKHPWKPMAVSATTIACYDLMKGVSAVNVPPMDIPLGQRISEATLTFYKSWWAARGFSQNIVVGEGEEFIKGREGDVLEIPPQQIIVAFSHGKNVSSRRIPSGEGVTSGCFWKFPQEFLEFIHGIAGVKVVSA